MLTYSYLPQAGMLRINVECVVCGEEKFVEVPEEAFFKWYKHGIAIQYAMPMLSADERELLMSQICGKCFERLFADD